MQTLSGVEIEVFCGSCIHAIEGDIDPQNVGADRPVFCYESPPRPIMAQTPQGTQVMSVNPPVTKDRPACGAYSSSKSSVAAARYKV